MLKSPLHLSKAGYYYYGFLDEFLDSVNLDAHDFLVMTGIFYFYKSGNQAPFMGKILEPFFFFELQDPNTRNWNYF